MFIYHCVMKGCSSQMTKHNSNPSLHLQLSHPNTLISHHSSFVFVFDFIFFILFSLSPPLFITFSFFFFLSLISFPPNTHQDTTMRLFISPQEGRPISLQVEPTFPIKYVKMKIQEQNGMPVDEQFLMFSGGVLRNDYTIGDYGIGDEKTLYLVSFLPDPAVKHPGRSPDEILVSVKDLIGHTFQVFTFPSDTLKVLKQKYAEVTGIPPDQQIMIFDGRQLYDEGTLADYHIRDKSTLRMVLRLRGG